MFTLTHPSLVSMMTLAALFCFYVIILYFEIWFQSTVSQIALQIAFAPLSKKNRNALEPPASLTHRILQILRRQPSSNSTRPTPDTVNLRYERGDESSALSVRSWFVALKYWFYTHCLKLSQTTEIFANRMGSSANKNETNKPNESENIRSRVRLEKMEKEGLILDVLIVEICGSIQAPADTQSVTLRTELLDVTNEYSQGQPVMARPNHAQGQDSATFYYEANLGKAYQKTITLTDWTPVARIQADLLLFPRRGKRKIQFRTSLLSSQSREELARTNCNFSYENTSSGYIDLHENMQHANTLTVGLAFAVGAADNKLPNCEVDLIKTWAMKNIDSHRSSGKARRKLKKALKKTTGFFRNGGRLNCYEICRDIVQISPLSNRYEILNLCLHVAQTKGSVTAEELAILKNFARWLEVDMDKFRGMMENILPANMHEVRDIEAILGLTADMQIEYARRQLNKEYAKWNARVTNSDPEVQSQADMMLDLIAEARNEYVGSDTPPK
jgi:hypothetical protein